MPPRGKGEAAPRDDISDDKSSTREQALAKRDAAFPKTNGKLHELTFTQDAQEQMRTKPTMAGCLLRSTKAKSFDSASAGAAGARLGWDVRGQNRRDRAATCRARVLLYLPSYLLASFMQLGRCCAATRPTTPLTSIRGPMEVWAIDRGLAA